MTSGGEDNSLNGILRDSLDSSFEEESDNVAYVAETVQEEILQGNATQSGPDNYDGQNSQAIHVGNKTTPISETKQKKSYQPKQENRKSKQKNLVEFNKINVSKGNALKAMNSYNTMYQKKISKKQLQYDKCRTERKPFVENNCSASAIVKPMEVKSNGNLSQNGTNAEKLLSPGSSFEGSLSIESEEFEFLKSSQDCVQSSENTDYAEMSEQHSYPYGSYLFNQSHRNVISNDVLNSNSPGSHGNQLQSKQSQSAPAGAYSGISFDWHGQRQAISASQRNSSEHGLSHIKSVHSKTNGDTEPQNSYSSIYQNSKLEPSEAMNYKPYTLRDYKRLKNESKASGLGPDTKSKEYQLKAEKIMRQKEYSIGVRKRNASEKCGGNKEISETNIMISDVKKQATGRRSKALEYAKTVPKPVPYKQQTLQLRTQVSTNTQEPPTMLTILKERHDREKKAIDAMRKELLVKFKGNLSHSYKL